MSRIIHNEGRVKVSSGDTAIEFLEDKLAAGSNVTITKTGGGGDEGLTIAATASVSNEDIQDAIGGILADSDTVDFTYDDAANSITATIKDFSLTRHKFNRESFEELVYDLGITNGDRAGKELLSSNRTYYVLTSGNNGNSGLVNNSGGAFATLQRAIDIISDTLDIGGYNVTIQAGAGTFTSSSTTVPTVLLKPVTNSGGLVNIVGDVATPSNVTIESTGYSAIGTSSDSYGNSVYAIRGFTITTSGSGTSGLQISSRFSVQLRDCILGATVESKASVAAFGFLYLTGDLTISGNSPSVFTAYNQALLIADSYFTVTIAGTPNFSYAFIVSDRVSSILWNSNKVTFSGGATGVRYVVSNNSVIYTAGGAENYFPGDLDGITLGGFIETETQIEDGSLLATKLHQSSLQELLYNLGFGGIDNERIDDRVAALLQAGSNITLSYDDNANTLTISAIVGELADGSILANKLNPSTLQELVSNLGFAQLGNLYLKPQASVDPGVATYSSGGDTNGIIYRLGTLEYSVSYTNPIGGSSLAVTGTAGSSCSAIHLANRNVGDNNGGAGTNSTAGSSYSLVFDFGSANFLQTSLLSFYLSQSNYNGFGFDITLAYSADNSSYITAGSLSFNGTGGSGWKTLTPSTSAYARYWRISGNAQPFNVIFELEFYGNYISTNPSYVIQAVDFSKLLTLGGSNTFTLRIPDNNSSLFKSGWYCFATYQGTATLTINAVGSATLNTACTLTGIGLNRLILIINLDGVNGWLITDITRATASDTKALLESLTGNNRLDAIAIKNLGNYLDDKSIFAQKLHEPSLQELIANLGFAFTDSKTRLLTKYAQAATTLTYSSDFDTNGVIYFLGTQAYTTSFVNPSNGTSSGTLVVSRVAGSTTYTNAFTDRDGNTNGSLSGLGVGQYYQFDFGLSYIDPNRCTFTTQGSTSFTFSLEGSQNGSVWTTLGSLGPTNNGNKNLIVSTTGTYWRHLRLYCTQQTNGAPYLYEVEFYGNTLATTGFYDLIPGDAGYILVGNNIYIQALRVPLNSNTFSSGWYCYLYQQNSGGLYVTSTSGANIYAPQGNYLYQGEVGLLINVNGDQNWTFNVLGSSNSRIQNAIGDRSILAQKLHEPSLQELLLNLGFTNGSNTINNISIPSSGLYEYYNFY